MLHFCSLCKLLFSYGMVFCLGVYCYTLFNQLNPDVKDFRKFHLARSSLQNITNRSFDITILKRNELQNENPNFEITKIYYRPAYALDKFIENSKYMLLKPEIPA